MTYSDAFREQLDSIKAGCQECIDLLMRDAKVDPDFGKFYRWAKENGIPVVVLSSGMTPFIKALLNKSLGSEADEIEIVCNELVSRNGKDVNAASGWKIQYRDDSAHGHDKSRAIRPYAKHAASLPESKRPILLYAGDGVSDLHAAQETDLLFAKEGQCTSTNPDARPDSN